MNVPLRLTDRKREAIVQAAIAEFRENSFNVTSMDRIAARAQVSKRTVYNHFPGKEELFAEMLQRLWESFNDGIDNTYYPGKPLREQLGDLLAIKMHSMSDPLRMDLARIAIGATIHSPERAAEWVNRLNQREEALTGWIRGAQQDGRFKPVDPSFAAHQIHALLKSFAFWPQVTLNKPVLDEEQQREVMESALNMFLGWYELPRSH